MSDRFSRHKTGQILLLHAKCRLLDDFDLTKPTIESKSDHVI